MLVREREGGSGRLNWCPSIHRAAGPLLFLHPTHEPESLARQRFDEALPFAAVADRTPHRFEAGCQRRIRNDAPLPDRRDEIVFADDAPPVADQVIEKIEHLRRNGDQIGPATQFPLVGVEYEVLEDIEQSRIPFRSR